MNVVDVTIEQDGFDFSQSFIMFLIYPGIKRRILRMKLKKEK